MFRNPIASTILKIKDVLGREGLDYAFIGGIAANVYGVQRPTYDVDVVALVKDEKATNELLSAFRRHGFHYDARTDRMTFGDFDACVLTHVQGRRSVRVDLYPAAHPFLQEVVWRRVLIERAPQIGNLYLASVEDLILLKLLSKRKKDLLDALYVWKAARPDTFYLEKKAREMHLETALERVRRQVQR